MCDCCSLMVTIAGGVTPEGGLCFSNEIISTDSARTLGQALSFGSLDYVADHSGELYLYDEASSEDDESMVMYPPVKLLCADLEVLSR